MYTLFFKFIDDSTTYYYSTENIESYNTIKEKIIKSKNSFVVDELKEFGDVNLLETLLK